MAKNRVAAGGIEKALMLLVRSAAGPMFCLDNEGATFLTNKAYDRVRVEAQKQIFSKQAEAAKLLGIALSGKPVSKLGKLGRTNILLSLTPVESDIPSEYFIIGSLTEYQGTAFSEEKPPESNYLLRTMAHELKSPLSNISLTLDLMFNECGGEKNNGNKIKMLERMKRQSFQLMELIDNFLDMARSKEGLFEPYVEKFELGELIDEVQDTIAPLAAGKGLEWKVRRAKVLPGEMESDPEMIKRVLLNFLSNACKFTEKGGISLAVGSRGDSVVFEISDSGCGIDEKDLERVFDPFVRGAVMGPRASGFGLGLSIAKMFVDALDGEISVESKVGRGSKFTLVLPLHGEKA